MLKIKVIAVGKLKEKFYIDACDEYIKRLALYSNVQVKELPEGPTLSREAQKIKEEIPTGAYIIAMCVEGEHASSTELAERMQNIQSMGKSQVCFILGSSEGMEYEIKNMAHYKLSMSKMTFPHHLARVMVLEQVYRALNINTGGKYHK